MISCFLPCNAPNSSFIKPQATSLDTIYRAAGHCCDDATDHDFVEDEMSKEPNATHYEPDPAYLNSIGSG